MFRNFPVKKKTAYFSPFIFYFISFINPPSIAPTHPPIP